jgi:hypothetical protein
MNLIKIIFVVIATFFVTSGFAQEKSKKQIKEEQKKEQQQQTEAMVNSKTFVFVARTALPQGYKTVNLNTSEYNVTFKPEYIVSYMPFYGKAYSGVGYGGDAGLKFEGKPEEFTVTKSKKNYQVNAVVKGQNDVYTISATISFTGSASLTILSNNRSSISYNGEIATIKETDEKH